MFAAAAAPVFDVIHDVVGAAIECVYVISSNQGTDEQPNLHGPRYAAD